MLADIFLHSASAALHDYLGSGSAAPVPVSHVSYSPSVLVPTSGSVSAGP